MIIPRARTLIAITGPTAIGKTRLAIQLAQYYHTEIISADSRQFYREMNIGTAKPSVEELSAVPHHFINSHSITDNFNVGDYEREALTLAEDLFRKHDHLILVGGSGLFVNAVCEGFDELPSVSQDVRNNLNGLLATQGIGTLQEMLKARDPDYYAEVDINNPQRIIRALEVFESTGKPFSGFRKKEIKQRPFKIVKVGLNTDRERLYAHINARVDNMMMEGLLKEVETLRDYKHLNPLNTVGYSELFDYLENKCSLQEAVNKIKQNTRRFAKRQLTWFRKDKNIDWFEPEDFQGILEKLETEM